MNSEQIESRFGSYRVKVLLQDANSRLASLCSEHDGKDICRTLAVTRFITPVSYTHLTLPTICSV